MTLAALLVVVAYLTLTMPTNAATRVRTLREPRSPITPAVRHLPIAAALFALLTLGPAIAVAVLVLVRLTHVAARRRGAAAVARANAAALPEVCRVVAAELRAGAPPTTALARAADDAPPTLAPHLHRVAAAAHLGTDPPPWVAAPGTERLHALAALWSVSADSGAGLADGVDRLADALSAEHRLHADTAAQLAGPRASAAVLAALPLLGLALAAALGARPLAFLTSPLGFACLAGAVALDATGLWWVRRLTRPTATPLTRPAATPLTRPAATPLTRPAASLAPPR